jgi:hypothetical protein
MMDCNHTFFRTLSRLAAALQITLLGEVSHDDSHSFQNSRRFTLTGFNVRRR